MRSNITLLIVIFFLGALSGCKTLKSDNMDFSTIQQLDLERYMGKWYEIARFDHRFERNLVGVTATYKLMPDGKITVVNAGYKNSFDGKYKTAKAKAKQPHPNEPGKLKVSFFLFFYADYYIFELDEGYNWALVGSSSDKYLWILSRTPVLEQETLDLILNRARRRGFDTGNLIWVEQKQ